MLILKNWLELRQSRCPTGIGTKLQRFDSMIAEEVINHFTKKAIPVLCIHDSFLVDSSHAEELQSVMGRKCQKAARKKLKPKGLRYT
jgi:hypothetical protein